MVELDKDNPNRQLTRNEVFQKKYDSITNLWNFDLTYLYEDRNYNCGNDYYVYCHMNSSKPIILGKNSKRNAKLVFAASLGIKYVPFYIGKGRGDRYSKLDRNRYHSKIRYFIENSGNNIETFIIKSKLTEINSFILEDKLIDIFGLSAFGGVLINIDEGYKYTERRNLYKEDYSNISNLNCLEFKKFDGISF